MKILVFGASGNTASYFIQKAIETNNPDLDIVLTARNIERISLPHSYSVLELDLHNKTRMQGVIKQVKPDIIVSFVGSSPMPSFARNLIESMSKPIRVIWLGAGGMHHETIGREGSFWKSMPGYFNQQLEAGDMIMEYSPTSTIINPTIFSSRPGDNLEITQSNSETHHGQSVARQTIGSIFFDAVNGMYIGQEITVSDSL